MNVKGKLYDISPILGFYPPEDLIRIFELLNNKIAQLHKYSSSDFLALTSELKVFNAKAKEIAQETKSLAEVVQILIKDDTSSNNQIDFITNKTKDFFNHITKLITDLQFHDIIRQKLENIQIINERIIEELTLVAQVEDKSILVNRTKYVPIIPDLALLQYKQFEYTNNEFYDAIRNLKKILSELEVDSLSINSIIEELEDRFNDVELDPTITDLIARVKSLGNSISSKTTESIHKLNSSNLFGDVIKELKIILIKINSKVKVDSDNEDYISNLEKIDEVKKLFTVASEHDIHKRLFVNSSIDDSADDIFLDEEDNMDEDDLELF